MNGGVKPRRINNDRILRCLGDQDGWHGRAGCGHVKHGRHAQGEQRRVNVAPGRQTAHSRTFTRTWPTLGAGTGQSRKTSGEDSTLPYCSRTIAFMGSAFPLS